MYTTNLKSIQQKYTEQQNYQTHYAVTTIRDTAVKSFLP